MLGLTPTFPTLPEYEQVVLNGGEIKQVLIRCEMVSPRGQIIAEGGGSRTVKQDYGDLNKTIKMCLKSAQIDATLRCAGLSELFTQDIEDGQAEDVEFNRDSPLGFGKKHPETPWRDVPKDYLEWIVGNMDKGVYTDFAEQELAARTKEKDVKNKQAAIEEEREVNNAPAVSSITEEQQSAIDTLLKNDAVTVQVASSVNQYIKDNPTFEGAEKTINRLEKIVFESFVNQDDLIKTATQQWNVGGPYAVEQLNKKTEKLFGIKTIDLLNQSQIKEMMEKLPAWETPF